MQIRPATSADVPDVLSIFNQEILTGVNAFDTEVIVGSAQDAWYAAHIDAKYPLIVAEDGDQIVGWASLSPWARHGAYAFTAEISIFIHEGHRGRGIGPVLLEALVEQGREAGHHVLLARAEASNGASRKLHLSAGFSSVGIMHQVGFKQDKYLDVEIFELLLEEGV